jgi:hypothetical protein
MSLSTRNQALLAKIESVYGTDPTPTGGANAILCGSLVAQPLTSETVERNLVRAYMGSADTFITAQFGTVTFEVEMAGAGATGATPAYDPLLKACGFARTNPTIAISSLTQTGGTATADLASAHGLTDGDVVTIAGAVETDYNGTFTVNATDSDSFTYPVANNPSSPATGSPVLVTSAVYTPVSSAFDSVTFYFYNSGILHKMLGARGSVEFAVNVRQIPVFRFSFTGLYGATTDAAVPSVDYSDFLQPQVANTQQTPSFSLFSFSAPLESLALNMANDVQFRALIGTSDAVNIVDRRPAGTLVIEAQLVASKDYWDIITDGTTGALSITHGNVGGRKVQIACPRVSLGTPSYQDSQGVQMLSLPFNAAPNSGNDEVVITVK